MTLPDHEINDWIVDIEKLSIYVINTCNGILFPLGVISFMVYIIKLTHRSTFHRCYFRVRLLIVICRCVIFAVGLIVFLKSITINTDIL